MEDAPAFGARIVADLTGIFADASRHGRHGNGAVEIA